MRLYPVIFLLLCYLLQEYQSGGSSPQSKPGPEICNNGIDDDSDGAIDIFDEDCACAGLTSANVVPNGNFEKRNGCCGFLSVSNCLQNWVVISPSPEYLSDRCPDAVLSPDVKALSDSFNTTFNEGYLFGLAQYKDGQRLTESMGTCLREPMLAGSTYTLSFELGNLVRDTSELLVTIFGISDCTQLTNYKTDHLTPFCEAGLPYERLGTVDARNLNRGWNKFAFEVVPTGDITAIFYAVDCDFQQADDAQSLYMALDNISIQEGTGIPWQLDIEVSGSACTGDLVFSVEDLADHSYQWYRDFEIIPGATADRLTFDRNPAPGTYHVLYANRRGDCRLSTALQYVAPQLHTEEAVVICQGESYNFGGSALTSGGVYQETLTSQFGCDSIITLTLVVQQTLIGDTLYIEQLEGTSYLFHGQTYTETGFYQTLLPSMGGCDSIAHLSIFFTDVVNASSFYIPNAFSPNSDGRNDYFQPEGLASSLELITDMKVFDRWGDLIFTQSKTPGQLMPRWDGMVLGKPAPTGVYFYVISWTSQQGSMEYLTGDVLLIR